jgi:putative nucleotidyltransferase with HDIG domain
MSNHRSTPTDVANIISQDQASASKILKAANSSIYGFRGRITTITQAITFIGFEEVKNLVLALSIIEMFSKLNAPASFNPVNLWKHSIAVGTITRHTGMTIGVRNLENYFIAGILHDIGKLLFYKYVPNEYAKAYNYSLANKVSLREAELKFLGITHTVVGDLLAEKWKLPINIRDVISNLYTGKVSGKLSLLVSCVHVANIASTLLEFGDNNEEIVPKPNKEVWEFLKLPDNYFTKNIDEIYKQYQESVALLLKV